MEDILAKNSNEIVGRLMLLYGTAKYKDLAEQLGVQPASVHQSLKRKIPIDWLLKTKDETGVSLDAQIYGPPPRRLLPESSNTTFLSDKIIAAVPEITELIEVRASDHIRERKINPVIIWHDFHAEYIAESELNEDRPQRAKEIQSIRDACFAAGTRVSWIDGSLSYTNYGRELSLHAGLILAQGLGQGVLRELGKYCHGTGRHVTPVNASGEQPGVTVPSVAIASTHIPADVLNALKDPEVVGMIRGFILGKEWASRIADK